MGAARSRSMSESEALADAALLEDTPELYTIRVLTILVGMVAILLLATIVAMMSVKFITY